MTKSLWIVLAAAALAAAFFLMRDEQPRPSDHVSGPAASAIAQAAEGEAAELAAVGAAERATPVAPAAATDPAAPTNPADAKREAIEDDRALVRGRVLAVDGAPLADFPVREQGNSSELARSGADGSFAVRFDSTQTMVLVADPPGWVSVRMPQVTRLTATREHLIVAAPAVSLGGAVVDGAGIPVAGATLAVPVGNELFAAFPLPLDLTQSSQFRTTADEGGKFSLPIVPHLPGAKLVARAPGHESDQREVPSTSNEQLVLELARLDPEDQEPAVIVGTVLLPDHQPAAGAKVAFASFETKADAAGGFEIPIASLWGYTDLAPLVAAHSGYGAAVEQRFGETLRIRLEPFSASGTEPSGPIADVVLVLGETEYELRGHVRTENGAPLSEWFVTVADPTAISSGRVPPVLAENLTDDRLHAITGGDGAFLIRGLLLRPYRIKAYSTKTLQQVSTDPILAGNTSVEIIVPQNGTRDVLDGRVESRNGQPLEGVNVAVGLVTQSSGGATSWHSGEAVMTDAEGRFTLMHVPFEHAHLDVRGVDVIPTRHPTPTEAFEGELVLTVPRRCQFRVEVAGGDLSGLSIRAEDNSGKAESITTFHATGSGSSSSKRLNDNGTMAVSAVSENVTAITLHHQDVGEAIARQSVTLDPDEINVIHFDLP